MAEQRPNIHNTSNRNITSESRGSRSGSSRRQSLQPAPLLGQAKGTDANEYEIMLSKLEKLREQCVADGKLLGKASLKQILIFA